MYRYHAGSYRLQGCWFALPPARQIGSGKTGSLAGPLAEVQNHQNAAFEGSDLDWFVFFRSSWVVKRQKPATGLQQTGLHCKRARGGHGWIIEPLCVKGSTIWHLSVAGSLANQISRDSWSTMEAQHDFSQSGLGIGRQHEGFREARWSMPLLWW